MVFVCRYCDVMCPKSLSMFLYSSIFLAVKIGLWIHSIIVVLLNIKGNQCFYVTGF
jgi:hypothetical protein